MANPIEPTPVLSGEDAVRFIQRIKNPGKDTAHAVDFKAVREKILTKAAKSGKKYFQ